jgi:hypothetical protein
MERERIIPRLKSVVDREPREAESFFLHGGERTFKLGRSRTATLYPGGKRSNQTPYEVVDAGKGTDTEFLVFEPRRGRYIELGGNAPQSHEVRVEEPVYLTGFNEKLLVAFDLVANGRELTIRDFSRNGTEVELSASKKRLNILRRRLSRG